MRWAARVCLRLYPRAWRERYGEEMRGLIDEMSVRPMDVTDLIAGAASARLAQLQGGVLVSDRQPKWLSLALGVAAFAFALPVALFVVLNLLRYQFGVLTASDDGALAQVGAGASLIGYLGGPLLALAAALLAMGRATTDRDADGGLLIKVRIRPSRLALAAAALSIGVLTVVIGYGISENLLTALR